MKVVLSTLGKFHTFDLARQLQKRGLLELIFTGYPRFKLHNEQLPPHAIRSFPWLQSLYICRERFGFRGSRAERELGWLSQQTFDRYVASRLPECDVFVGLSGSALRTGRRARSRGARYICDRGSAHIRVQDRILRDEFARQGSHYDGIDPRTIATEEGEYEAADLITVPSLFAKRSFVEAGVPESKVAVVSYGVDLSRFQPTASPEPSEFHVLFVGGASFQKGIPDLLTAFGRVRHPRKRLTLVGAVRDEVRPQIGQAARDSDIACPGHMPQGELKGVMSRSHVLVLPSVQDGFGMVLAQAMACGCPVIGTTHTGAPDLITDGVEGYIVPPQAPDALADRLQRLADDPALQQRMSQVALVRVQSLGGWDSYGEAMVGMFGRLGGAAQTKAGQA